MRLDTNLVLLQIANLKLSYPDIWDDGDEKLLTDCIEAETGAQEFLRVVVDRIQDATTMAGAIATRIAELEVRQDRYVKREKAMRALAFKVMEAIDRRSFELPEATLSIRNGSQHVTITDESLIPDNLCEFERKPQKARIKDMLKAGGTIAGAILNNGAPNLSIRVK